MNEEEFNSITNTMMAMGRMVQILDLSAYLNSISTAESIGPILDPTLYMKASDKVRDLKSLANALLPFKREVEKQVEKEMRRIDEKLQSSVT